MPPAILMAMDRVIDEIILVALCLLLLPFAAFSGAHVAALLCAIVVACCFDVYPHARLRFAAAGAYELAALFVPEFSALLPVVAYVLFGERFWLVRLSWIMPLAAALRTQDVLLVPAAVLCAAACLMAWRTKRAGEERERYRALRDEQQEASLSLANKNRELMAAQDYEVRLATCPSAAASPARYTTTWVICSQDRCCRWRRCKWCTPTTSAFAAGWHRWARRCTRPWTRCAKACTTCTTMRSIYARVWKASSAPAAWTTATTP